MDDFPPTFSAYMEEVDDILFREYGLTHQDFPDQSYRDAYGDEVEPEELAFRILEEEGFTFDDDDISTY